ncbi:MAG: hypothetical protein ACOC80_15615, partial [Petrotogales bacterium]
MNMHKRIVVIGIILLFIGVGITSGMANTLANNTDEFSSKNIEFVQNFSEPLIKENGEFVEICIDETNSFMTNDGAPMMPFFSKTYEFPLGTEITNIRVATSKVNIREVKKQIKPVPSKQKIGNTITSEETRLNREVYTSSA